LLTPRTSEAAVPKANQKAPRARIVQSLDASPLVELKGNVYPAAKPAADQGSAPANLALQRMVLVLKRSDEQQKNLENLLRDQQNRNSPSYHSWVTPQEFGAYFGAAPQDVEKVSAWLGSSGFAIESVSPSRTSITFSGTNAQLNSAFHSSLHQYKIGGQTHFANSTNPMIPSALAPVVAGIAKLNDFPRMPMHRQPTAVHKDAASGRWTAVDKSTAPKADYRLKLPDYDLDLVGPQDFATMYNLRPLWDAGIDGTGQHIAIVSPSDIQPKDVDSFRASFGLPATKLDIIYNGPNPGLIAGYEGESDLDVQWAGAVAKNATIHMVVSGDSYTTAGVDLSAIYIVDHLVAPVMSESYGECEVGLGTAGNQFYANLWAQAAAEGITALVSSGDAGSAGCDQNQPYSSYGLAVNGIGSTPFNMSVGGTDLYGTFLDENKYWGSDNGSSYSTAKSYVPERPWNNSCGNPELLKAYQDAGHSLQTQEDLCNDPDLQSFTLTTGGGSGGPSNCIVSEGGILESCSSGYAKPAWQAGIPGIPDDKVRDLPDVSLFSGAGLWGSALLFCESDATNSGTCDYSSSDDAQMLSAGGTSFASPAFAGIISLINQQTNQQQGNANYTLYKLAAQQYNGQLGNVCDSDQQGSAEGCIFHDVTSGSIATPCLVNSIDCTVQNDADTFGVLPGWSANEGYDMATGLGSVNIARLVNAWSTASPATLATTTTLTLETTSLPYGTPLKGSIQVSLSNGQTGAPTGDTALVSANSGVGAGPFHLEEGKADASVHTLPVGMAHVSANYSGDGIYGASRSADSVVTVSKAATNLSLVKTSAQVTASQSVSLVATIGTSSFAASPSGTVTFSLGTSDVVLGSSPLVSSLDVSGHSVSIATLTLQGRLLNAGDNTLTATYLGDANYNQPDLSSVHVSYQPPFSLSRDSAGDTALLVNRGGSVDASLTLTATSGSFPANVTLSCTSPQSTVTCSFTPITFPTGGTTTKSVVSIHVNSSTEQAHNATRTNGSRQETIFSGALRLGGAASFCLLLLPLRRKRLSRFLMLAVLCVLPFLSFGGCGGSSSLASTALSIKTSSSLAPVGSAVTFTVALNPSAEKRQESGTVTLYDGDTKLGNTAVTGPTATFTTDKLTQGIHHIRATYSGDGHFTGSPSDELLVTIVQPITVRVSAMDTFGDVSTIAIPINVD